MTKSFIQKIIYTLTIALFSFLSTACSEDNESSLEISNPTSCVFPGKLQLDNDTKELLKKYQQEKSTPAPEN